MASLGVALAAFGGLPLVALGGWVWLRREQDRRRLWLAVFVISMGLRPIGTYAGEFFPHLGEAGRWIGAGLHLSQAVALTLFAVAIAGPLPRAAVGTAAIIAVPYLALAAWFSSRTLALPFGVVLSVVNTFAYYAPIVFFVVAALLLSWPTPRGTDPGIGAIVVATALVPGYVTWAIGGDETIAEAAAWRSSEGAALVAMTGLLYVGMLAVASLWLARDSQRARAVAWAVLAIPALSGIYVMAGGNMRAGFGIARLLTVLIITYAVFQSSLVGMRSTARWTLSKGSVAAVFVTMFFVASELAQAFFGERLQSEYMGIAAAGLLVLGIAPLQRVADRLAASAIPDELMADQRNEAAYLAALRAANRDGVITRREERHLAEVAEHLELPPMKALALREQVEKEAPA